ncbi:hypothetical protein B7494_g6697 [Chlorociboria aeruginascens]|nr:hypothetical protein B7494_g6697 [Chlorociboria aeruginascens]
MDPVTAAGIALAVIPLIISAVENYEVTFQPFVTYCRYVKEIERFTARLDAQRAIFRNECQLLFLAVSNGQNLNDVLNNSNHPIRNDREISRRLQDLLGSSYTTCVKILTLIKDTLEEITQETKDFRTLHDNKVGYIFSKTLRIYYCGLGFVSFLQPFHFLALSYLFAADFMKAAKGKMTRLLFRQKIKISFSKTRLNDITDELRRYNEDLVTLSRQIRDLAAEKESTPPSHGTSIEALSHFDYSNQASSRLYEILAAQWACDDRIIHVASMSLEVKDAGKCRHASSKVCFSLRLSCGVQNVPEQQNPLWLEIESAPNNSNTKVPQENLLKDPLDNLQIALEKMGSKDRTVRFDFTLSDSNIDAGTPSTQMPGPQLDLCTIEQLCKYFHNQMKLPLNGQPCMGFLQKSKTFKHFVYPTPGSPESNTDKAKSLKQSLQSMVDNRKPMDWVQKLKLARLLALSVLRFQGTRWLSESWSSNDIYLPEEESFESPFLNVQLSHTTNQLPPAAFTASSIATNATLFGLGVVLLELGYDAPLHTLRKDTDLRGGPSNEYTDFFTAQRISKLISKRFNTTYGKLVQKCLYCNFGVETDLDSAELQSAVVINVVNELDKCLKACSDFNLLLFTPMNS